MTPEEVICSQAKEIAELQAEVARLNERLAQAREFHQQSSRTQRDFYVPYMRTVEKASKSDPVGMARTILAQRKELRRLNKQVANTRGKGKD